MEKIIRWYIKHFMPGYSISKARQVNTIEEFKQWMGEMFPGYYVARNPKREKKVWKESTLEDARDMAIEIAERRKEHDGL